MTPETALDTLTRIDPRRTYCVSYQNWRNVYAWGDSNNRVDYQIDVFPPVNDYKGALKQIRASSFSEAVKLAIEYINEQNAAAPLSKELELSA